MYFLQELSIVYNFLPYLKKNVKQKIPQQKISHQNNFMSLIRDGLVKSRKSPPP